MSDLISRADAIEAVRKEYEDAINIGDNGDAIAYDVGRILSALPSAEAVDCTDFIDWIRKVVADEELWDLNAVGYGEVICRKLVEIGALATTEKPPYYYVPSADAEQVTSKLENPCDSLLTEESNGSKEYKSKLESAEAVQGEWIFCGEKMPRELERVNVTWLNHNPPFYYQHIKDIPQTDTAVYYRGKWYWWDATVIDVLAEYGEDCNVEQIDKDIEVVAWMPLPKPYECGARMENKK